MAEPRKIAPLVLSFAFACGTGDPAAPQASRAVEHEPALVELPAAIDVGTSTIHRLNGVEFDNTVRDLFFGDAPRFASTFPPDDGEDSFTNNADALSLSPLLFERYELAADQLAARALTNSRIMACGAGASSPACATEVITRLAPRAWRRPVDGVEVARLVSMVERARADGLTTGEAVALAIKAILLSPRFLFRAEIDPDPTSRSARPLEDHELASRLSYFLWSSMPDDVLFAHADAGELGDPATLDAEVERMLRDPKARALVDNFASQWLLHTLSEAAPGMAAFPSFDEDLRSSMAGETREFLSTFLFTDESLADVFDARFSFLDARMAAFYGIPGAAGDAFVRVPMPSGSHRGGLLTHASILTMTSVATRTSPVRRGEWVLSELLCSPPPPPPPNVPALEGNVTTGTMRQRMEEHRKNPACASCHTQMDPIGLALEHYDGIGRWRDTDQGLPIDATGQLPGGDLVDGADALFAAIKKDPRFASCATRKLYAYALGRRAAPFDEQRLLALSRSFVDARYRTRELISSIIHSDAFRMRRSPDPEGP